MGLAAGRALGTGNGIAHGQEAVCERRRAVGERRRVLHSIACRVSAMRQSETHDRSLGEFARDDCSRWASARQRRPRALDGSEQCRCVVDTRGALISGLARIGVG